MYLPILKAQQVDVIVALTHLTIAEDRVLAERFPEIDLIVGGHEHEPIAAIEGRAFISKAGSDAEVRRDRTSAEGAPAPWSASTSSCPSPPLLPTIPGPQRS